MLRESFHREMREIELDTIKQAAVVLQNMANIVQAMQQENAALVQEVIASDKAIRAMQRSISERYAVTIACQAPVACDLRHLLVMAQVSRELKGINQRIISIALYSMRLNHHEQPTVLQSVNLLAQHTLEQVQASIQAFVERNTQQAYGLLANHKVLDCYCETIQKLGEQDSNALSSVIRFSIAATELYGMRKHVITICEQVIYLVLGEAPALA